MMKPAIPHSKVNTGQFQPSVVIVAEIVFAALLLYLANHPVNLDEFTQAENSTVETPAILENPSTKVAVVSTPVNAMDAPVIK